MSDDFSVIEYSSKNNTANTEVKIKNIEILLEAYYAVFYDTRWYLGRIIKTDMFKSTLKFLHFNLDQYFWPKTDDIAEVENKYIFYGPVELSGCCPFYLKRTDNIGISKKYKEIKKM